MCDAINWAELWISSLDFDGRSKENVSRKQISFIALQQIGGNWNLECKCIKRATFVEHLFHNAIKRRHSTVTVGANIIMNSLISFQKNCQRITLTLHCVMTIVDHSYRKKVQSFTCARLNFMSCLTTCSIQSKTIQLYYSASHISFVLLCLCISHQSLITMRCSRGK